MNGRERVAEMLADIVRGSFDPEFAAKADAQMNAIAADLDAPIRWRPIAEYPYGDGIRSPTVLLFAAVNHEPIRIGYWHRVGLWVTGIDEYNPTHFAELKGPQ